MRRLIGGAALHAALLAALLAASSRADAVEYEVTIDIDNEDDLYELHATEQISDDTFNALLDLFQRGVDLGEADREEIYALPGLTMTDADAIVAYRKAAGGLGDPRGLVPAGVLSEDKLRSITPFLANHPRATSPLAAAGLVRLRTLFSSEDDRIPTASLDLKIQTLRHLTVGASLLLIRDQVSDVRWDASRNALSANAPEPQVQLAKIYADWRTPSYEILVGNYRAGFAQRLVFDDTSLYTPNGFYPDEVLYRTTDLVRSCNEAAGELDGTPCAAQKYVTPDFRFRDGLFGVAFTLRQLTTDAGWLQITGFLSRQVHTIYQYEIYNRDACSDPTTDSAECAAPDVFHRQLDLATPTSRYTFQTLPDMWAEPMGGGNVSFFFNRRTHLGVTGYGARPTWLVDGADLDFQEWSRFPFGGGYGAVGADAAWGADIVDVGVEVARSFDGAPAGGGGLGAIARATLTWPKNELELSLRYYDEHFANPYAGSIAEPDEVDGQRARDEVGVRLRFAGRVSPSWDVRTLADFWVQPTNNDPKIRLEARTDYYVTRATSLGVYARWQDKDLRTGGLGACYDTTTETDENGEPVPCTGQKIDVGFVGRAEILPGLVVTAQLQDRYLDDPHYLDTFRQDLSAWLSVAWAPTNALRFNARCRFYEESLDDPAVGEESIWSYVEASYRASPAWGAMTFRLRYDNRYFLDDRQSTLLRVPNPEHWFRLEVESRF